VISSGDKVKGKLSARFFNRGEQVFDWYERNKARGEGAIPQTTPINNVTALIRNNTGIDLRRGEVVEFDGSLLTQPDPRVLSFSGVTPDLTRVGWGITLQQIPSGSMNEVLCLGLCIAHVQFSDESHQYADRVAGQRVLNSAGTGPAKILHKGIANPSSEGEFECLVQIMDETGSLPLIRFELTSSLSLGGNTPAKLLQPTAIGTGKWEAIDPEIAIQVYDPYEPEGMWNGGTGSQGWAYPRGQEYAEGVSAFDIVWMERPAQLIRGTSSGSWSDWQIPVAVSWFDWQGLDPGSSVMVHDPAHSWRDVPSGSEIIAYYNNKDERYEILHGQRVYRYARATLTDPMCGDTMAGIDSFEGLSTGDYIQPPEDAPTTASNPRRHAGLSGDTVTLLRIDNNLPNPTWEIIDVDKHVMQPIVGLQLDGLEYQYRTHDIYTEICTTDPNEWVTWLEGDDECPDEEEP
jgi:hypothetical protein